jgi:beta-carotene 3-hydroxylase
VSIIIAVAAFVAMEPVTAASHRWLMHGIGACLHRSHHRRVPSTRWEANDWFPVMFASIVMLAIWAGFNRDGLGGLVPAAVGVTVYGVAYALVHDVYIHNRLALLGDTRLDMLDRLAEAHHLHHLYGEAPYGMLIPIVPVALRERASDSHRDPLVRT